MAFFFFFNVNLEEGANNGLRNVSFLLVRAKDRKNTPKMSL